MGGRRELRSKEKRPSEEGEATEVIVVEFEMGYAIRVHIKMNPDEPLL